MKFSTMCFAFGCVTAVIAYMTWDWMHAHAATLHQDTVQLVGFISLGSGLLTPVMFAIGLVASLLGSVVGAFRKKESVTQ